MKNVAREIAKLGGIYARGHYQEAFDTAGRIRQKIKRMRQAGLDESGIYAPENLAFKMLRMSGYIQQLFTIYTGAYDKLHSLDQ